MPASFNAFLNFLCMFHFIKCPILLVEDVRAVDVRCFYSIFKASKAGPAIGIIKSSPFFVSLPFKVIVLSKKLICSFLRLRMLPCLNPVHAATATMGFNQTSQQASSLWYSSKDRCLTLFDLPLPPSQ